LRLVRSAVLIALVAIAIVCPSSIPAMEPDPEGVSEQTLKQLVCANPDSSVYYAKYGLVRFAGGRVRGRAAGIENMKIAIRKDPENMDYRLMLAEMYLKTGRWARGTHELRALLDIDPNHDLARCRLGKAYFERAIKEWGTDWFVRAKEELSRVRAVSPVYCDARKHLALCHHDLGCPDSSILILREVPPENLDAEALLILGMSLCSVDETRASDEVFSLALQAMDEGPRGRYTTVEQIASSEEMEVLAVAGPGGRPGLMHGLWRSRDPNPGTEVNERLVEHLARVTFADIHFSVPNLGKAGSQTARGEMYIRYGRPRAWASSLFGRGLTVDEGLPIKRLGSPWSAPPSGSDEGGIPGKTLSTIDRPMSPAERTWTWHYEDFTVDFEDRFHNGDFTFPYEGGLDRYAYTSLREDAPEIYEMHPRNRMNVVLDALNFTTAEGSPYIKVVFGCDTRGLEYSPDFAWPRGEFEVEIAVLDSAYCDLRRDRVTMELKTDPSLLYETQYPLIGIWPVEVPPGKALAAVSVRSKSTGAVGFTSKPVDVSEPEDHIFTSDIELRFSQDGLPNPTHTYLGKSVAYLAFSIYNILPDELGLGRLEIAYGLSRRKADDRPLQRLWGFISGGEDADLPEEITSFRSKHEMVIRGATGEGVIGIDLSPLSIGDYSVMISVTDRLTGETSTARSWLRIES